MSLKVMYQMTQMAALISCWIGFASLLSAPALAEITPDATLPNNTTIDRQNNTYIIRGGTRPNQGRNLFHSFREFSVPEDVTAQFDSIAGIDNIFARVTGRNRSEINGTIRAGDINLFLLNPNGIIFGRNAFLNIGGSFLASTADRIRFSDGSEFSAVSPRASSLLTINAPIGLQFGRDPQPISNASQTDTTGLEVSANRTLALVGGPLSFPGGSVTAGAGRIELGAVGSASTVGLNVRGNTLTLGYRDVLSFQDIQLSDAAIVDVSSEQGGSIQIQGRNIRLLEDSRINADTLQTIAIGNIRINAAGTLTLRDGSQISTSNLGSGQAGDVIINAGSVELIGTRLPESGSANSNRPIPSTISSQVDQSATGNGGNVIIRANRLIARNGGSIEASTSGEGRAGNIDIQAGSIELAGSDIYGSTALDQVASGIFAQVGLNPVENTGDAGSITIQATNLTVLDGAQISSAARRNGAGGNVEITATDAIRLSGQSRTASTTVGRSGIFTSAERGATQNAGQMTIRANQLIVENQGEISANNFGPAQGGTIRINVDQLTVRSEGDIRASSNFDQDLGAAGNLIINAREVNLADGQLTAETGAREGANIRLRNLDLLTLLDQSLISAQAFNAANGGNVEINAANGFIVASSEQNNDIIASAERGNGGRIDITALSVLALQERIESPLSNDIDASSEFGIDGQVILNTPDIDPSQGTAELPSEVVDATQLIAQNCSTTGTITRTRGEFTIAGRSGLPANPIEPLRTETTLTQWIELEQSEERSQAQLRNRQIEENQQQRSTAAPIEDSLVEAQGWTIGAPGEIILLAETPDTTSAPVAKINCETSPSASR